MKKSSIAAMVAGAALLFGACGDDGSTTDDTTVVADSTATADTTMTADTTVTADTTAAASDITVEQAWARTSPMAATMGAAYMTITSPIDDELVSASVDTSIAMEAQIHETVTNDAGEMEMREVESIALTAGTPFELKPGAHHIMLMGLKAPLEVGSKLAVTLTMKSGATVTVDADVLEDAPSM